MSLRVRLYAVDPQELEQLVACYRPMGFHALRYDDPLDPARARVWLDACAPLLERIGARATPELLRYMEEVRERQADNLYIHSLFQRLATEYVKYGLRPHAKEQFTLQHEMAWEAFQLLHFDRKPLVPTWQPLPDEDPDYAFASAPFLPCPSECLYLWRSAEQVRAFFPKFHFFRSREGHLTSPTPQQVIAHKEARGRWVAPSGARWSAYWEIAACEGDWGTLVELLRTAAQSGWAFLSVSQDTTSYE